MKKQLWNEGWQFSKQILENENVNDFKRPDTWTNVDLPHDWLIEDTYHLYQDTAGWYQKKLHYVPDGDLVILRFEGVYMDSVLFVNDTKIHTWRYGYSTFDVNLSPYLKEGDNLISLRVLHQSPNSRWYTGAGIYRNVWLIRLPDTHFPLDGLYITPVKTSDKWTVQIDCEIHIGNRKPASVHYRLSAPDGSVLSNTSLPIKESDFLSPDYTITQQLTVSDPLLWDIGKGNLYRLSLQLEDGQGIIDEISDNFGFRTISFDSGKGFFLNDRHVKIKGVCEHHGFSCLGAVTNRSAIKRKLKILRKMGVNAIRTAHNMPSVEFMELADQMGFLVDSEAFDMWGKSKTTYDYGRFFDECYQKDVASWIRRDRNHPSIVMWSVGNEIYDMHEGEKGYRELEMLIQEVRRNDPLSHAKITFASNYMRWENAQKCAELVDLVGYNYGEYLYDEHHEKHPDWIIYGSETSSMLASRGVYHFPLDKDILCEDDQQCSALGNSFAGWGAHDYLDNIIADRDREFSLGQFIWSGFDYFGEPTPYHTRNSYFGQIDTAGFPKDSYYIYQAEWTDCAANPMIHIFPYWDFNEGQIIDVCVCSNAPLIELFLNGTSLGKRSLNHANGTDLVPHFSIPYQEGELLACAYDSDGKIIATDRQHSFLDADALAIASNQDTISSDADDLLFLEISALDSSGYPVANANNRVFVTVEGPAVLLGLDNGDSTDFEQVKASQKRLFQGKLLAVIAPEKNASGAATITVSSKGLKSASFSCVVRSHTEIQVRDAQACYPVPQKEIPNLSDSEIPIRKIALTCDSSMLLTPENNHVRVNLRILPENASYKDLQFKIVNDIGIDVSTAVWERDKEGLVITAIGDGDFQLRCIAQNGGEIAHVRSTLNFHATGFGPAYINPFRPISTALCINRPRGLSEGIDHGVRFLGKENTGIYFGKMDFGTYGACSFTAELFKYTEGPVSFKIYEEIDSDNSSEPSLKLLLDAAFHQDANWLEFKSQTYTLSETISGIRTIRIESEDNFQLRSFFFHPVLHGLEKVFAGKCDEIFGDSYTINQLSVENIGNNTTLTFRDLNLGEVKSDKIRICGKTSLPRTTVHLKIESETLTHTELLEFETAQAYEEREFSLPVMEGTVRLSFVFLPGSQFDFAWFRLIEK